MEYRTFGGTGIQVSKYCLGAMMFGGRANDDHAECVKMIHRALDAGINFVDTADGYSRGESEQIVGKALAGRRDDVVLATKCYIPMSDEPNHGGGSRRWILRAVEDSLRRLGTDWIDVFQLHRRDYRTDLEESLGAMTDLLRQGKIRAIGMSATPAHVIVEGQWTSERRGLARVRSEQCLYSILSRGVEEAVLPTCQQYGIAVMTYSPLSGSWLTGRHRPGVPAPAGSRASAQAARWDSSRAEVRRKYEVVDQLGGLAQEAGLPLTHLATAFAAEHPAVSSVIIGPRTPEQLEDTLASSELRLTTDVLDRIDAIVAPATNIDRSDTFAPLPSLGRRTRRRPS